jgi:regulator of protease activity HflC (stomatin/prohibitin superfamily)
MRVVDPVAAIHEVDSYHLATYTFVQVALRETVAGLPIDDLLGNREAIGPEVLRRSAEPARAIGVELVGIDVKDLMFPGPLKRLFAQVIEARQQGLASLEKARGETAALRSLANAARLVDANPSLLQLRLLQQLESTSGNTIVLGMPSSATPLPLRTEPPTGGSALASGPDQSDPGERRS